MMYNVILQVIFCILQSDYNERTELSLNWTGLVTTEPTSNHRALILLCKYQQGTYMNVVIVPKDCSSLVEFKWSAGRTAEGVHRCCCFNSLPAGVVQTLYPKFHQHVRFAVRVKIHWTLVICLYPSGMSLTFANVNPMKSFTCEETMWWLSCCLQFMYCTHTLFCETKLYWCIRSI